MSDWIPIEKSLPAFGTEVLVKCTGWSPKVATYIANPHCQFSDHMHCTESGECYQCCGIWMLFDHPARPGRVINAPIEAWCEIPKLSKEKKHE